MPDDHATPYDAGFYEDQMGLSVQSAHEIVPIVVSHFQARSVVDVGCGVGGWLKAFAENPNKVLDRDQLLNLVLDESVEHLRDPADPTRITDASRPLGRPPAFTIRAPREDRQAPSPTGPCAR